MYGWAVLMQPPGRRASASARRECGGTRRTHGRGGIARVDAKERRFEREQLAEAGDDLDVLDPDAPDERGAQLLVASTENRALAADHPDHNRRRLVRDQVDQVALGEVAAEQPACAHGIDAEEGLLEPERPQHATHRRPGPSR